MPRSLPIIGLRLGICLCLALSGCGNRFNPSSPFIPTSVVPPAGSPLVLGISDLVAGDGMIRVGWRPADNGVTAPEFIRYRVYLANGPGDQDFATPNVTTVPGVTFTEITGLPNGIPVFVVVRSVDPAGTEDQNTIEWVATPNPVRYVRVGAPAGGANGLTPQTPFPSLGQAVNFAIPLQGVNFWLAEGLYFPENVFLFPAMSAFGGFTADFALAGRDPERHVTQFATNVTSANSVVEMTAATAVPAPAGGLIAIDGLSLVGNGVVPNGVFVEDAFFRISRCQIFDIPGKGIELRSDAGNDITVEGSIRECIIEDVMGEGVFLDGIPDVVIDNNQIRSTGNEGIESQWIRASAAADARIDITRNVIQGCGDEGIDLDFAEANFLDPTASQGARVRAFVRNNRVERCKLQGILFDIDHQNSDGIDIRVRCEDNEVRACGLDGILINADAMSSFRVARNSVVGNGGAGIFMSGTQDGPWVRLLHNRIMGNGAGIHAEGSVTAEVRHQLLRGNRGPAVHIDRATIDVVDSILMGNAVASTLSGLRHSILFAEPTPSIVGEGVVFANPGLENHPDFLRVASAPGNGTTVPLSGTSGWQIGDAVEIRDDGVRRTVIGVGPTSITIDPPVSVSPGDLVSAWGNAVSVFEFEGLLAGSLAINAGDPLESDRDGTRADLGPIGGDTPGNVGIDPAIPLESAALELTGIDPPPSELQLGSTWTLAFNRVVVDEIADHIRIERGGVDITSSAVFTVLDSAIEIDLTSVSFSPGETVRLEMIPGEFFFGTVGGPATTIGSQETDPGRVAPPDVIHDQQTMDVFLLQPAHVRFEQRIGASVADSDQGGPDTNGTIATAQLLPAAPLLLDGTIGFPGDTDVYRVDLAAGERIRAELFVGQIESPLIAGLELIAGDGTTVLQSVAAGPPIFPDPVLPTYTAPSAQTVYLRVQSAYGQIPLPAPGQAPIGAYQLVVR